MDLCSGVGLIRKGCLVKAVSKNTALVLRGTSFTAGPCFIGSTMDFLPLDAQLSCGDDKTKGRWTISSSALYLLEQVFKMERFPSLHMRQRLAADPGVTARQVGRRRSRSRTAASRHRARACARAPGSGAPGEDPGRPGSRSGRRESSGGSF